MATQQLAEVLLQQVLQRYRFDTDASTFLEGLILAGARQASSDGRLDEAVTNLETFLASAASGGTLITVGDLRGALSALCPLYPFC